MQKPTKPLATIDSYIKNYPKEVQTILKQIRDTIRTVAPKTTETISYGVPTFKFNTKPLIYFAAYKKHISIYPASDHMMKAIPKLTPYRTSTGTLQFPLNDAIPFALIKQAAQFRLKQLKAEK